METPFLTQLVTNYCHCGECDECALHAGAKADLESLMKQLNDGKKIMRELANSAEVSSVYFKALRWINL